MTTKTEKPVAQGPAISSIRNPTYLKDGAMSYEKPETNTSQALKGYLDQKKNERPTKELILEARKYLMEKYEEPSWRKSFEDKYFVIPYLIREVNGSTRIIHIGRERRARVKMPGAFVTAFDAPEFTLKIIGVENGLATNIEIQDKDGNKLPILAVRYPISKTIGFQDYISTPYTEALNTPEIMKEGKTYLTHIMTRGALDVEKMGWISPEIRTIGNDVVRGLIITESMDPSGYTKIPAEELKAFMTEQINHFYILLGANDEIAFRRASSMGARGIVQMIARTFNTIIERFPHPHVHHDFEEGTKDHRGSIILAYGHLQMEYNTYQKFPLVREWILGPGKPYLAYLLAAGYNSNNDHRTQELERVLKDHKGKNPDEIFARFIGSFRSESVRNETIPYLRKFAFVMREHFKYDLPALPEPFIPEKSKIQNTKEWKK